MGRVITLNDGENVTVLGLMDIEFIIRKYAGDEVWNWLENYMKEYESLRQYITYLEEENERLLLGKKKQ